MATSLDLFQRHIGTLEGVDTIDLYVLSHLGMAEGLDLSKPNGLREYIPKMIGLDVLPEQTEPGPWLGFLFHEIQSEIQ